MFNVGGGEFLAILVVALIVLGPDKLPDAARKAGKLIADVRRMSSGFQTEMKNALNTDELKELRELRDTIQGKNVYSGGKGPSLPPLESEVRAANVAMAGVVPGSEPVSTALQEPSEDGASGAGGGPDESVPVDLLPVEPAPVNSAVSSDVAPDAPVPPDGSGAQTAPPTVGLSSSVEAPTA